MLKAGISSAERTCLKFLAICHAYEEQVKQILTYLPESSTLKVIHLYCSKEGQNSSTLAKHCTPCNPMMLAADFASMGIVAVQSCKQAQGKSPKPVSPFSMHKKTVPGPHNALCDSQAYPHNTAFRSAPGHAMPCTFNTVIIGKLNWYHLPLSVSSCA